MKAQVYTILFSVMLAVGFANSVHAQQSYWQQRVDYQIDVKLDTASKTLDAFMVFDYYNNSPDTLEFIWMQLFPNAFKTDRTAFSEQYLLHGETDFYFSSDEERGYIHRLNFESEGRTLQVSDHPQHIDIIKLHLNEPLLPGNSVRISTPFRVKLPKLFSRMGVMGPEYAITHWYPVPAMYDKEGWHPMPYLNLGEYYAPFGKWTVNITVPESMKVAATGRLIAEEKGEISEHQGSLSGYKTLQFSQDSVHAFAWFASDEYIVHNDTLKLPSGRIIDVYVYRFPNSHASWDKAMEFAKSALWFRSVVLGEYPYAIATVVAGYDDGGGGMEYPTITRLGSSGNERLLDYVIEHELGHNWFYGILATNERQHPWMDEGMNSYYDNRYMVEKYGSPNVYLRLSEGAKSKMLPENENEFFVNTLASLHIDQPMNLPAEDYSMVNYSMMVYSKVALWMEMMEKKMGRDTFDKAMREYYDTWKFKHPGPEEFREIMVKYGGDEINEHFELLSKKGPLEAPGKKTIKPVFFGRLAGTEKYNYLNLMVLPGINQYDGFMAGLLMSNYNLPLPKFRFAFLPQYGFGSKKINYLGSFGYNRYADGKFRRMAAGMHVASYAVNDAVDSLGSEVFASFRKFTPFVKLEFNRSPVSRKESYIQFKSYQIFEKDISYVIRHSDSTWHGAEGKFAHRYVNELKFFHADYRVLYPWSVELKLHQAKDFFRADAEMNYFFNYRHGGGLGFRIFASKFHHTGSSPSFSTLRYQPKLTAVRGWEDYTYSTVFLGRNEVNGFGSRQIMGRDGNLKIRTDMFQGLQGRSGNWVAAINLNTTLPEKLFPIWLPVSVFFDAGTYAEAWDKDYRGARFMYVGGLRLSILKDVLEIYAPILMSAEIKNNLNTVPETTGFGKRISFTLDIQKFGIRKISKGIL